MRVREQDEDLQSESPQNFTFFRQKHPNRRFLKRLLKLCFVGGVMVAWRGVTPASPAASHRVRPTSTHLLPASGSGSCQSVLRSGT